MCGARAPNIFFVSAIASPSVLSVATVQQRPRHNVVHSDSPLINYHHDCSSDNLLAYCRHDLPSGTKGKTVLGGKLTERRWIEPHWRHDHASLNLRKKGEGWQARCFVLVCPSILSSNDDAIASLVAAAANSRFYISAICFQQQSHSHALACPPFSPHA